MKEQNSQKPRISFIVAMAQDRVIGFQGKMPWHLPADLNWFKKNTLNKPVIMGRKTFDSIGKALPHRLNIVLSKQQQSTLGPHFQASNVQVASSFDKALAIARSSEERCEEMFVIGGGDIYHNYLDQVDRLYLTTIDLDTKGDTYFPEWRAMKWRSLFKETHQADEKNPYNYSFEVLERM